MKRTKVCASGLSAWSCEAPWSIRRCFAFFRAFPAKASPVCFPALQPLKPGCVHYDQFRNTPVVSRFFQVEAAHHRTFFELDARLTEPAFYQRWHEPVRPDFPGTAEMPL